MKLFEIAMGEDTMIRNTIGRTMSAEGMVIILRRLFGYKFSIEDVAPYVRPFNEAIKSINPHGDEAVYQAKNLWERLAAELSHPKTRRPPNNYE